MTRPASSIRKASGLTRIGTILLSQKNVFIKSEERFAAFLEYTTWAEERAQTAKVKYMKRSIAAVFALGLFAALPAQAHTAAGSLALSQADASAAVKADWDDWHNRWRSHRRWGPEGGWGEHNRWRSHNRWGSRRLLAVKLL